MDKQHLCFLANEIGSIRKQWNLLIAPIRR